MNLSRLLATRKIQLLIGLLVVCAFLIFLKDGNPGTIDLNMGIEFAGGVRVPISLEKPVDAATMAQVTETLKQRMNKFGLSQVTVRPLGNKEVLIELPQAQAEIVKTVESILREQGRFEAIVDGRVALNSSHIIPTSIGGAQGEQIRTDGSWELVFSINAEGELHFAEVASGKRGEEVYMFLDRPQKAALLVSKAYVTDSPGVRKALHKENDDIALLFIEDFNENAFASKPSTFLIPKTLKKDNPQVYQALIRKGYSANISAPLRLLERSVEDLTPEMGRGVLTSSVFTWRAIGLRSAPTLSVEPIRQAKITPYSITGAAQGDTPQQLKDNAVLEVKELKSVLTGGRLPVAASVGSYYNIAPTLGSQFLTYSFYGIAAAILFVSIVVTLYYRRFELVMPVIFTGVVEIFITLTLMGTLGTIDLAAMAGVIALIGSSTNNQIIITDELLKKRGEEVSAKRRFKDAFYIVFTTAGLAFASMLPLLMSGIVEITGFAVAALISVVVGIAVTRPAYGAVVEEAVGGKTDEPFGGKE